ncbi:MAG: homocitrate synthase [Armatimonadota bacterium]
MIESDVSYEGASDWWESELHRGTKPDAEAPRAAEAAERVQVVDTTLRDGEQTAGIVFSNQEKVEIARMLADAGVYQIEAGVPSMGGDEQEAVSRIVDLDLGVPILGWNRAVVSDIEASIDCGVDGVCIGVPTSHVHIKHKLRRSEKWVLESIQRTVEYAKSHGLYVSANAEDASRTPLEFLIEFAQRARDAGADRLRYCDTIGFQHPFRLVNEVHTIKNAVGIPIEIHTHNDFGMATANTIAGIRGGATFASVTVNGLGERAGNAALEEVVMALKCVLGIPVDFNFEMIRPLCEYVAEASGREIGPSKPIVGHRIFYHEAGTVSDGVLKLPETHEPFTPAEVGGVRQITIGKHSGGHSLRAKFAEFGIDLREQDTDAILDEVRSAAVELKRDLFEKELMQIYRAYTAQRTRDDVAARREAE